MKVSVDGWSWMKLADLGEISADIIRRKLTLVDSVKKSAVTYRAYQEKDDLLGIPRAFFKESAVRDHKILFKAAPGLEWPERVKADPAAPWAAAQDGGPEDLVLVDAFTGEKSADFFSKDQKTGIGMILKSLCSSEVGDGMAVFASEQAAAKVCLSLIRTIKMRTLVLTPPGASFAMWRTVAGRYLPDAKIGTIRRGERDEKDAHVTIATVDDINDFIARRKVLEDEFGFVISHQIHKLSPVSWSRAISFFSAAKRLGITDPSAAFNTGFARVFRYHLGDPVFCADPDLETPKVRRVWSSWKISTWARVNPQFVSKETLLSHMCSSTVYNPHVVEQVILAMKAERKIVLVSDKVAHLKALKMQIETTWSESAKVVDFAIEGMPPEDLAKAVESDVILTTFSFVKSLPEMPTVDTIVLATPTRDPLPAVRLCLSRHPSKKPPVIVDMRCDDIPVCRDYGKARDVAYRSSFGAEGG
jgi:hypothetical protein